MEYKSLIEKYHSSWVDTGLAMRLLRPDMRKQKGGNLFANTMIGSELAIFTGWFRVLPTTNLQPPRLIKSLSSHLVYLSYSRKHNKADRFENKYITVFLLFYWSLNLQSIFAPSKANTKRYHLNKEVALT
jgi:hypothetical protein